MTTIKLHQLPIEVLAVVIQKLRIQDVYNLIRTCKAFKNIIINDNGIWRSIGRSRLIVHEQGKTKSFERSWYHLCRVSHNWCKGRFKNRNIIVHNKNYMPWLKFHQSEALLITVGSDLHCYPIDETGFPNGRHLQWKLSMPQLRRHDKRTDDISRFVLRDNLLVCGNRNGATAVYKVDSLNNQPQRIQYINKSQLDDAMEVSCVEIVNSQDGAYLITGSTDSPMVLFWNWNWDSESPDPSKGCNEARISFGMELGVVFKETAKCLALNTKGDKLAIGPDGNSRPVLVDINRVEFLIKSGRTSDITQIVQDVRWHDNNTLCYVTHAGHLQMMDIRTEKVVYSTKDPFQASFYCVKSDGNHGVVAGTSQHARCVLYDTRKPQHVQLFFTQDKWKMTPIYSLDFNSSKLIAAGARAVAALNFNVHKSMPAKDYSDCVYLTAI